MSDATGAADAREFEVDVEDFAASLQHLADRMREIEEALEEIFSPAMPHLLSGGELAELETGLGEADRGETISGDELFKQLRRHG
jgi:predicted transcriptional regulator